MVNCYVVRLSRGGYELLQLRRAAGNSLSGAWSVVRGKIKADETAWQAALRELQEETSLHPSEFYQLDTLDAFYLAADDTAWNCPGFCAIVDGDAAIVLNHEHDAHRWIDRKNIDRDFLWPGERLQLAELCREILDNGPAKKFLRVPLPQ